MYVSLCCAFGATQAFSSCGTGLLTAVASLPLCVEYAVWGMWASAAVARDLQELQLRL